MILTYKHVVIMTIALGCLVLGFCGGIQYQEATAEPVVVTKEMEIPVPVYEEVVKYVDVPRLVIKEVPVITEIVKEVEVLREVEKPVYPQEFESKEQMESWVFNNEMPVVLIAGEDGKINLIDITHDPRYDCDDYATDFENMALADGYKLTACPVTNGEIWGIKVSDKKGNHVGAWTKINGVYYYVEPMPESDEWKIVKIMAAD